MTKEDLIKNRYYELLSEDDKFNLLVVKDIEIDELKEKLAILDPSQANQDRIKSISAIESENKLAEMNALHKPKIENGKSDFYLAWRLCFEWVSNTINK